MHFYSCLFSICFYQLAVKYMINNITYQKSNVIVVENRMDCNEHIIIIQSWNIGAICNISKPWMG